MRRLARCVLITLVLAGVVMPVLGILAFARVAPPVTPFMLIRAATGSWIDYHWVPMQRMSPHLVRAVIAAEDARFLQHSGFDWTEMESALQESERGGRLRGASTISMQCARVLFLWPGRGIVRKGLEAYLTVWIEALWNKARILEVYLNTVEWGDGIYGCEAAAQRHLDTACTALDAEQAARLAAILPNPHKWSASRPGPYVRQRAATILERMSKVAVPRGG